MVKFLVAEDVVIRNFLLADPALLCSLLVALGTAGLVISHEEDLAQLLGAVLTPGHYKYLEIF